MAASTKKVEAPKTVVKPIPDSHPRVSPYLVSKDAARVLDFLRDVLDAKEGERLAGPDGKVKHGETRIGDSVVMVSEASDACPPMPAMLYVYVEDVDRTYAKALAAGATPVRPPVDQYYGDRSGGVQDHAGNQWWFGSRKENLTMAEVQSRARAPKR